MSDLEGQAPSVDAGKSQLARVYARAFVAVAQKSGDFEPVSREFHSLVFDVLQKSPGFLRLIHSPRTSSHEKIQLVQRVFGGRVSPTVLQFLQTIISHNRFDCLNEIALLVRERVHELQGRVRVQVRTAEQLDDTLRKRIVEVLNKAIQKEVVLEESVDPELLGGLVVRVGDQVIDGSVRHRLEQIRQDAVRRARQEIQVQSERFAAV